MFQSQELHQNGYVSFPTDYEESMLDVSNKIGDIYRVSTMPLVQTLTPRLIENEKENTYSGNYGLNEFPFHTDLAHWFVPPRYLLLRCVKPGVDVPTRLIDSKDIINEDVKELFDRAHFMPRKRLDRRSNLLRIFSANLFRWDSLFIEPANKVGIKLKAYIDEVLPKIEYKELYLSSKGDCLLIDNWRMLHSRGCIDSRSMERKIERVYFNEVIL